jgi:hypothetical protein
MRRWGARLCGDHERRELRLYMDVVSIAEWARRFLLRSGPCGALSTAAYSLVQALLDPFQKSSLMLLSPRAI